MKQTILVIYSVIICLSTVKAQDACSLFKAATKAYCNQQYDTALVKFSTYRNLYPDSFIRYVNKYISTIYALKGDTQNLVLELQQIINQNNDHFDRNSFYNRYKDCLSFCENSLSNHTIINDKYFACLQLAKIYRMWNKPIEALSYIDLAEYNYMFSTDCGNDYNGRAIDRALMRSDIYLSQGDTMSAIKAMCRVILLEGGHVIRHLKPLLNIKISKQQQSVEINKAINSLRRRDVYADGNTKYSYDFVLYGQVVQSSYGISSFSYGDYWDGNKSLISARKLLGSVYLKRLRE